MWLLSSLNSNMTVAWDKELLKIINEQRRGVSFNLSWQWQMKAHIPQLPCPFMSQLDWIVPSEDGACAGIPTHQYQPRIYKISHPNSKYDGRLSTIDPRTQSLDNTCDASNGESPTQLGTAREGYCTTRECTWWILTWLELKTKRELDDVDDDENCWWMKSCVDVGSACMH